MANASISELNLNAGGASGAVTIDILLHVLISSFTTASVIDNLDTLENSAGGTTGEVGNAANPFNCARCVAFVTSNPRTNLDLHWALGEFGADIRTFQGTLGRAVNKPLNLFGGPFKTVEVRGTQRVVNGVSGAAIVCAIISLGKVVGLDILVIVADCLKVDFIKVVGKENDGADYALARCSLHFNVDSAKEDVVISP